MFLLLLSLSFSTNKKTEKVVVVVEVGVGFKLDGNEVDKTDLRLKIEEFAAICFYFTNASFSLFFSH